MSCYFRNVNVKAIFSDAGVVVSPANKKEIDQTVHEGMEISYKNCPDIWKKVKTLEDDHALRRQVVDALKKKKRR